MAAEKYRTGFIDRCGKQCRIEIWEDTHIGGYTLLKTSGSPLKFDFDNESDNVFDPIRITQAVISIISTENFSLIDLYSVEDMHFPVFIYIDDVLYFRGYIATRQYQEPYDVVPNIVSITAIDGLELLEEIKYKNGEEYYNGRRRESQIMLDILNKIGFTTFFEFCNIYEDRMLDSVNDSPFDQTFIDVDIFKDKSCYEVLTELLIKYNAIIRQHNGIFCITRPVEMIEDNVAGRFFVGVTTKNSVTITPDQFIRRISTHPSKTIRQIPNGILMEQSPAKKVTIIQDYGYKESWIDNWELKGNTYNDVTGTWDGWTNEGAGLNHITDILPEESDGCVLPGATTPRAYNIFQEFGQYLMETNDVLGFSFDYLTYNFSGIALTIEMFIKVAAVDNSWFLNNYTAEYVAWTNSLNWVDFYEEFPAGSSGWKTYSRKLEGLPTKGPFIVTLYGGNHSTNPAFFTCFKNIRLFSTSDKISIYIKQGFKFPYVIFPPSLKKRTIKTYVDIKTIVERKYIKTNPINGKELEYDCLLGDVVNSDIDNVLEQFAGALAVGTAQIRVDTITLTGTYGQCALLCNGVGRFAVWSESLTKTAADFVINYASLWLPTGVVLTSSGADVIFTGTIAGVEFYGETSVGYQSGTLDGTVEYTTPADDLNPTEVWYTRSEASAGESEAKELLQITCDEIADQYSRPKQLIQMPIADTSGQLSINLLGNIQDTKNTLDDKARCFVVNRGWFDVYNRMWELDLFEIGTKEIVEEEVESDGLITADMMLPTVDNTYITIDNG